MGSSERETILTLRGELDLNTQPDLAAALASIEGSCTSVVLDLAELTFMDASSSGIIHRARTLARSRGADLELRSPHPNLLRILELTELMPTVSVSGQMIVQVPEVV